MATTKATTKGGGSSTRQTRPSQIEAEVMELLGTSGIHTTRQVAQGVKRSDGAVRRACKRLYKRQLLRLSRTPRRLYRFLLTGEILHGGNYPVITRLISMIRGASHQSGSLRARLPGIFAGLRAASDLQQPPHQRCIARCEAAAKKITSDKALLEAASLRPFTILVTHWWPRVLEDEYVEPMAEVVGNLNRRRIEDLAGRLPRLWIAGNEQLLCNPSPDEKEVEKVVRDSREACEEVLGQLEDSGAEEFLAEREEQLTKLGALETIPREDVKQLPEGAVEEALATMREVSLEETPLGKKNLILMTPEQIVAIVKEALDADRGGGRRRRGKGWKWWLANWVNVAIGTGLVAMDFTLAWSGSLAGVLPSVAGADIGTALGVTGSVHTGAKSAVDALTTMSEEIARTEGS